MLLILYAMGFWINSELPKDDNFFTKAKYRILITTMSFAWVVSTFHIVIGTLFLAILGMFGMFHYALMLGGLIANLLVAMEVGEVRRKVNLIS